MMVTTKEVVEMNGHSHEMASDISRTYPDLTEDEKKMLLTIRQRKIELLREISKLKDQLTDVNSEIDAMDSEEGAKVRNLQLGKKKFNMDPKKGIEFLVSGGMLKNSPEEVRIY